MTHSHGFKEPNTIELTDEARERIIATGAKIYTGTMITHSLETALAKQYSGVYPTLLVAQTLRRFGEGIKVCCEMIMMAADAGLIPEPILRKWEEDYKNPIYNVLRENEILLSASCIFLTCRPLFDSPEISIRVAMISTIWPG